ncbi:hypothetical protein PL9214500217 [Planktothrix tepida PCC 9214]|uniref:Uncharacterized protein n=1 Tax=Planktothrix tepida PCC 9214 TaxID=671072 RepID=A0A1J1LLT4_9CYAN|nr:hypothetical protein PL9214500217 [Planktothrix tepida PCC 9214]
MRLQPAGGIGDFAYPREKDEKNELFMNFCNRNSRSNIDSFVTE